MADAQPIKFGRNQGDSGRTLVVAFLVAMVGGAYVWYYYNIRHPSYWSDFDQIWIGARALLEREDPYRAVPEARFPWPLYYPVPALLFGLPFALFPLQLARALFAAASAGLCTYAILRWRPHAWPLLCTGPFLHALQRGQWSPLLVASVFLPVLGGVVIAKPTIGAAVFAYRPSRTAMVSAFALGLISLIWSPDWVWRWLAARHGANQLVIPALLPGGFLLLIGLLRWRRPEARLLGVLAVVPQTFSMYEMVSLGLIPQNRRDALALALLFNVFTLATIRLYGAPLVPAEVRPHYLPGSWAPAMALCYLPALWLVLRPFPLWDRPATFARWSAWQRVGYQVLWGLVLGLILLFAAGGGWVASRHLLGALRAFQHV